MTPDHLTPELDALTRDGRADEALALLDQALAQDPANIPLQAQRSAVLIELRRFDEAMVLAEEILQQQPDQLQAMNSLAVVLVEQNRLGDAFALFRRAFALHPTNARLLANYGNFLSYAGVHEAAIAAFTAAVSIAPQDREIGVNHGMCLLRAGNFDDGWAAFEQRRRHQDPLELAGTPPLPPLSTSPNLDGRNVLVFHEQGLGDSLQFIRYVPLLAARGATVLLRMPPPLTRIAGSVAGCACVVGEDDSVPDAEYVVPMMSLPRLFEANLATIPAAIPYLHADPADLAYWREAVSSLPRPRIGLVWAGSPKGGLDHRRSIGFEMLAPIFELPAGFVSLQLGEAGRQWAPPRHAAALDPTAQLRDFADTAALICSLDLVISVDTSTAHMAGALGCPVFVLDRFDSCWRWLSGRSDSPWYPSLRLFRQPKPGDWAGAIAGAVAAFKSAPSS